MSSIVACDNGAIAAPHMPWIRRKATSWSSVCAAPQSMEATVNPIRQPINSFFRPKRRAIHPTGAVIIAAAMTYDVRTQVISSDEADMLPCM